MVGGRWITLSEGEKKGKKLRYCSNDRLQLAW